MEHIGETEPNVPAMRVSIKDVIREYEDKLVDIPNAIERFKKAEAAAKSATSVGGAYGGEIFGRSIYIDRRSWESALLKSAWRHIYDGLQIATIASARDRDRLTTFLEAPEPFTLENIRKHFGDYVAAPRWNILKGLAECFTSLDPAYKSHSKVKIGVSGLPKRVIISNGANHYGYGVEKVKDVFRVLSTYRGIEVMSNREFADMIDEALHNGETTRMGITIKTYRNGNAHLIFDKAALLDINRALAEFYGEVLPDSPEAAEKKQPGTAVAADLAYYPTPTAVIDDLVSDTYLTAEMAVLEPSCGDGRILKAIIHKYPGIRTIGIEVHPGRAKPGGILKAVLPATAKYDHDYVGRGWESWRDLPVGYFRESGTGVPTGIYTYTKPPH